MMKTQITLNEVELQPLKDNSVYVVKFNEVVKLDVTSAWLQALNDATKDHGIVFVPNYSPLWEIVGEEDECY